MSDGPHRTLNLRQQWKQVLQRAHQRAFDSQDVIDAICPALERDCAWELPKRFVAEVFAFCTRHEPSLFGEGELDQLKRLAAGRGTLGGVIADCVAESPAKGIVGEAAARQGLKEALADRLVRNARQMEEHVLREAGERKATEVRNRLATAIEKAPVSTLADKLMTQAASPNAAPPKHDGIDDGVGLR
jgi:hypothetical protein